MALGRDGVGGGTAEGHEEPQGLRLPRLRGARRPTAAAAPPLPPGGSAAVRVSSLGGSEEARTAPACRGGSAAGGPRPGGPRQRRSASAGTLLHGEVDALQGGPELSLNWHGRPTISGGRTMGCEGRPEVSEADCINAMQWVDAQTAWAQRKRELRRLYHEERSLGRGSGLKHDLAGLHSNKSRADVLGQQRRIEGAIRGFSQARLELIEVKRLFCESSPDLKASKPPEEPASEVWGSSAEVAGGTEETQRFREIATEYGRPFRIAARSGIGRMSFC